MENLYEKAKKAIDELFSDESVTQEETKENLESLMNEIQTLIETLDV